MMADFEPRIEDPPGGAVSVRKKTQIENEKLREFVRGAYGKWCIVSELHNPTLHQRHGSRARFWSVFTRVGGYLESGFEIYSVTEGKTYKIYARYDSSKEVKSPQ